MPKVILTTEENAALKEIFENPTPLFKDPEDKIDWNRAKQSFPVLSHLENQMLSQKLATMRASQIMSELFPDQRKRYHWTTSETEAV